MAITIHTTPTVGQPESAYRPIYFKVSSDRDYTKDYTVNAVADNGSGKCRYSTTGLSPSPEVNDVLIGSGFDPAVSYNVAQTVTSLGGGGAGTLDTDLDFDQNDTGKLSMYNENFKIKAEIYNGTIGAGTKIGTSERFADNSGYFHFDFANYLRTQLTPYMYAFSATQDLNDDDTGIVTYQVRFTEQHDDKDGILTNYNTGDSSSDLLAINATLQHKDTQNFNAYFSEDSSHKFLTNVPDNQYIYPNQYYQLGFLLDSVVAARLVITKYPGATTLTADDNISTQRGVCRIPYISGITYCTVHIADRGNADAQITEKKTFYFSSDCTTGSVRMLFLNQFGNYDAFTFFGNNEESLDVEREKFQKHLDVDFNYADAGWTNTSVKSKVKGVCYSGLLSSTVADWLKELIETQQAYIHDLDDSTSYLTPIIILNSSQMYKSRDAFYFKVEYMLSNERIINQG